MREGLKSGLIDVLLAGDSACISADVCPGRGGSLHADSGKKKNRGTKE
jgi:hypothetical protein